MNNTGFSPASLSALRQLWKDTFHDSDSYVNLVFQRCFSPELTITSFQEERLAAALFGVPFSFLNHSDKPLRGLYLCGLATRPEFRRRGIMTRMLIEIEQRGKEAGFDFTFLIPASDGLRRYYADRGYVNGAYRAMERFTSVHNFVPDEKANLIDGKVEVLRPGIDAVDLKKEIAEFCSEFEKNSGWGIARGEEQFRIIIEENLVSGGEIFFSHDDKERITGIAFAVKENENDSSGEIEVRRIMYETVSARQSILQSVRNYNSGKPIKLFLSPRQCNSLSAIRQSYYVDGESDGRRSANISSVDTVRTEQESLQPYAMFRLLRREQVERFMVSEGWMKKGAADMLSDNEFSEIIWRRPIADKLIDDSLQIGWLPSDVSLMLD